MNAIPKQSFIQDFLLGGGGRMFLHSIRCMLCMLRSGGMPPFLFLGNLLL